MKFLRFAAVWLMPAIAQDPSPGVIQIYREPVRPGKMSFVVKIEEEAARFCATAHCPNPYVAISSITGPSDIWWINGVESFDALEKLWAGYGANREIMDRLDSIAVSKGDLVFPADVWIARLRDDLSWSARATFATNRYLSISVQRLKPGQLAAFEKLRTRPRPGRIQWVYQVVSGSDSTFVVIAAGATAQEAMVPIDILAPDLLDSSETRLYAVSPSMSFPAQAWIETDPDFWKHF